MTGRIYILSLLVLFVAEKATAQQQAEGDSSLRGPTTIEVIQSYKPEVKLAPKPEFIPDLPPRDTTKLLLNYEVPQQTLYFTYHSLPLRPLALGRDTSKLPYPGYIKLAGGNFSTIYLDAGVGMINTGDYEAAVHLHHLSQEGTIKNQKISFSGFETEGTLHSNSNAWHLAINGFRNEYHYFGYDHAIFDYDESAVRQTYTGVKLALDLRNEQANSYGINYHPLVWASVYADKHDAVERTIALSVPFSKDIDTSVQVQLGFSGLFTQLKTSVDTRDNNIFQITPGLNYHRGSFSAHAGLYPAFAKGAQVYLLPDAGIRYKLPGSVFFIDAGWKSSLCQNSFEQLSSHNPYIFNIYEIRQTKIDEAYAGFQTSIGNHLDISSRISILQYSNLPVFLNDTSDQKNFYILYDEKVSAVSIHGAILYQVANSFSAGINATLTNYYKNSLDKVWQEPGVQIKGDLQFCPARSLTLTGYAVLLDQIFAKSLLHRKTELDPVTDLGIGAEYVIIPRLSIFLNVNNILNNRYERWYRYESYGVNIFGGLRLKF